MNIIFNDQQNEELDRDYAEKLIEEFRKAKGWKVEEGTKIHDELLEFSKGYSKIKRNVVEVVAIFRIATGL